MQEVKYLDHVLSAKGIRIGDDGIKAIVYIPTPNTIEQLRSVLKMIDLVRKSTRHESTVLPPLVELNKVLHNVGVRNTIKLLSK